MKRESKSNTQEVSNRLVVDMNEVVNELLSENEIVEIKGGKNAQMRQQEASCILMKHLRLSYIQSMPNYYVFLTERS